MNGHLGKQQEPSPHREEGGLNGELRQASDLMRQQAESIIEAAGRLETDQFARAVSLLSETEGKAVLSGAGTSGIIARKIAATLTSTGTPALFLHPSDALHGALGLVDSKDVAVVVSNSGETHELLTFLPYLQHRKVPLIAIVGNLRSTIARNADALLDAFAARESCPLNLAPTSSTSVALALGDALAMTVMQVRELTPQRFALNHPSGRLGKRLTLTVSDLMHAGADRPRVTPQSTFFDVVSAIGEGGLGAVTVEGPDDHLLGIITDGDLRRVIESADPENLSGVPADGFMTREPVWVAPDRLAYEALQLMENRPSQISVLPVADYGGHCVGLVRLHDLIRSGL
jgi:arabinose-5-phosphate isomerase